MNHVMLITMYFKEYKNTALFKDKLLNFPEDAIECAAISSLM